MQTFRGWTDAQIATIACPALVISGNQDVGSLEHAVEMARVNATELIREFLDGE